MVRGLLRLVLVVIVVVAAAAFFFGYRWGGTGQPVERPIATSGREPLDPSRAREAGAAVAEKMAIGANRATDALADASLTAKIKSKLALDDTMDGSRVSVDTDGTTVTLGGHASASQKARAVRLARETDGVTSVVDRIDVR